MEKDNSFDLNTEEIILNTAYNLLTEKGYSGVSTREIASAAGVALSQLNYYFKSKEKLFLRIIDLAVKQLIDDLKQVFSTDKTRRENFAGMIDYFKYKISHDPELFKLIFDFMTQAMWNKEIRVYIYGMMREVNYLVQTFIIKSTPDQKSFNGIPVIYASEIVIYGVLGLSLHFILGHENVNKLDTEYLTEFLFNSKETLL